MVVKKLITFFVLSIVSLSVFGANLTLTPDRHSMIEGETLRLSLVLEAQRSTNDSPDFSPLHRDFNILGQNQSSQTSIINGKRSDKVIWTIEVSPKSTGPITIPSLQVGPYSSKPVTISVATQPKNWGKQGSPTWVEVVADTTDVYEQQQVMLTIRAHQSKQIRDHQIDDLNITGAKVYAVNNGNQFEARIHGTRYFVYEKKYIVFPESPGTITIPSIAFQSEEIIGRGSRNSFMFNRYQTKRTVVRSEPLEIEVKPKPAFVKGWWLPAKNVSLRSASLQPQYNVGDSINVTIYLEALGVDETQLPHLDFDLPDSFKQYPATPQTKTQLAEEGLRATLERKIVVVPTEPGEFTIPSLTLTWWNTSDNKIEVAKTQPIRLTVKGTAKASQPSQSTQTGATTPNQLPQLSQKEEAGTSDQAQVNDSQGTIWMWCSLALAFLWVSTLVWGLYRKPAQNIDAPETARKININTYDKPIQKAVETNNLLAFRQLIIPWLNQHHEGYELHTLADVSQYLALTEPERKLLDSLDSALFSTKKESTDIHKIFTMLKSKQIKEKPKNVRALSELNFA